MFTIFIVAFCIGWTFYKPKLNTVVETQTPKEVSLMSPDAGYIRDYIEENILSQDLPYTIPKDVLTIMSNDFDFLGTDLPKYQDDEQFKLLLKEYINILRLDILIKDGVLDLPKWKEEQSTHFEESNLFNLRKFVPMEKVQELFKSEDNKNFISEYKTLIRQGIIKYTTILKEGE